MTPRSWRSLPETPTGAAVSAAFQGACLLHIGNDAYLCLRLDPIAGRSKWIAFARAARTLWRTLAFFVRAAIRREALP